MTPAQALDERIAELADWRGKLLAQLAQIINAVEPKLEPDWKWGTAVWSRNGLVCAASAFKSAVKLNFFNGYMLQDQDHLLNSGFESKKHRAIDFHEGDKVDSAKITKLIQEAVALNGRE